MLAIRKRLIGQGSLNWTQHIEAVIMLLLVGVLIVHKMEKRILRLLWIVLILCDKVRAIQIFIAENPLQGFSQSLDGTGSIPSFIRRQESPWIGELSSQYHSPQSLLVFFSWHWIEWVSLKNPFFTKKKKIQVNLDCIM